MSAFSIFKKSGYIAAFFYGLFFSGTCSADGTDAELARQISIAARSARLSESAEWLALIHSQSGRPLLKDPEFLLSFNDFSAQLELDNTIAALFGEGRVNVCRFPARYHFLKSQLAVPDLPLDECPEVREMRDKAPVEKITLIFASENIFQPASMMGHSFLKISGLNHEAIKVDHAISFYTDTTTLNIPVLFYESTISGKKGYFSLSPYSEKVEQYLDGEQRNIWEYELKLSPRQRERIALHLLELKNVQFTYFFHDYNCATVITFILSTTGQMKAPEGLWVTPRDTIKLAQDAGLIGNTNVLTSYRWTARTIASQLDRSETRSIRDAVLHGRNDREAVIGRDEQSFLRLSLAEAYNQYALKNESLPHPTWKSNQEALEELRVQRFPDRQLKANNKHDPRNSPQDSQIALGVFSEGGKHQGVAFSFLPVSHRLSDDNRNYGLENELILFETGLRSSRQNALELDHFTLYRIQSLTPRDALSGGISGRLHLGIDAVRDRHMQRRKVAAVEAAIGLTERIHDDTDLFALMGATLAKGSDESIAAPFIEAGAIVREVFDMKSILTLKRQFGQLGNTQNQDSCRFVQSAYLSKQHSIQFEFGRTLNQSAGNTSISLVLKSLF